MKNISKSTILLACALGASSASSLGCSVTKKLDGMYDSTKQLAKGTDDLSKKQAELYDALRQGNAVQARREILNQMLSAKDSARKISEAGKYFSAFEFQIWSNLGLDTPERRVSLQALAAKEFMRDVQEFMTPRQSEPSPLAQGDPKLRSQDGANRQASLNALSVAMHLTNPKQDELLAQHPEFPQITMYNMIQTALRAKAAVDSGQKRLEDFPDFVREILTFEDVARLLVQARFNFFGSMLLASTSTVREGDHTKLGLPYWANYTAGRMRYLDWKMDIADVGLAELNEDTLFMMGALKVVAFMKEIGMTPKLNSTLHGILAHAQYPDAVQVNVARVRALRVAKGDPATLAPLAKAQTELADAFETYRAF